MRIALLNILEEVNTPILISECLAGFNNDFTNYAQTDPCLKPLSLAQGTTTLELTIQT